MGCISTTSFRSLGGGGGGDGGARRGPGRWRVGGRGGLDLLHEGVGDLQGHAAGGEGASELLELGHHVGALGPEGPALQLLHFLLRRPVLLTKHRELGQAEQDLELVRFQGHGPGEPVGLQER